jgi:arsenite-transporting ATPase
VNGRYELQLQLPFISKEEVDVRHNEGELYVTVGAYKREISLPRILNGKQVSRARLDDGLLRVTFTDSQK